MSTRTININPDLIMPARLDWPSAIGNLLLNYGTLDFLVFCFLKDHLSAEEFAKVRDWHFKDRLGRIAQHLQEAKCPVEQQNQFAELVRQLEPIRELRNHIAHGHMYLRIDEETRQLTATVFQAKDLGLGWTPDANHVEFPELLADLNTLNELIQSFQNLAGFKPSGFNTAPAPS